MEKNYEVYFGESTVGRVQMLRQGLYYQIHCRCRLTGNVICRLYASVGDQRENLGVLVPMDGGFGLDTRIPVKRLGEGELRFDAGPKHEKPSGGRFVPIYPEEPFAYLERLKDAYLARQDGQLGVMLRQDCDTI